MTNNELNYNIAVYIMDWSVSVNLLNDEFTISADDFPKDEEWNPAENMNQAFEVVKKIYDKFKDGPDFYFDLTGPDEIEPIWTACITPHNYNKVDGGFWFGTDETPERAICKATLNVVKRGRDREIS